jgi:hypothetical protein
MARVNDRRDAIGMRLLGYTYGEIRDVLGVSKSTLSEWLSKFPLNLEQIEKLEKRRKEIKIVAIEKTIATKRKKYERRLEKTYDLVKRDLLPLSKRELYVAGLALYWGEGKKSPRGGQLSMCNTDPAAVKFYLYWLLHPVGVPREKVRVYLHLYSDMNPQAEQLYWSKQLGIPLNQFTKPYIKRSLKTDIDQKGFGHGTCAIVVNKVLLKERILMGIKAVADCYGEKLLYT